MDIPDKPPLDPYVWEIIELSLHKIDKSWWTTLSAMTLSLTLFEFRMESGPAPPKQPIQLKMYLRSYASELFNEEISYYPKDHDYLPHWAQNLAGRVEARIIKRIREIEAPPIFGVGARRNLSYHGVTEIEMRETIRECLKGLGKEKLLTEPKKQGATSIKAQQPAEENQTQTAPTPTEVERRKALLAEYKAATGDPTDYQIYNAQNSGIHSPEFYKWKRGELSRHSKTANHFEHFLLEKKPPIPRR